MSEQTPAGSEPDGEAVTIDCDRCVLQYTSSCKGCLVSFVLDRDPGDAVIIDADEARALRMLNRAGLLPPSRFEASAS
ncbi:MAG TPA: hypothetical protein VMQ40_05975 [Acidimicrobiales bacterium]|jgi:hypothetical protein|nr:hypothetical protein [Acidimicrobiales bacterium]